MFNGKKWLRTWGFGVAFFLCVLTAWQASAQTLVEGRTAAGARHTVLVDATGAIVLSSVAALGLVQVAGVNGTTVATSVNPFPVWPSADGTNPVDATHPLPVSGTTAPNSQANRLYVMAGLCYPDWNPAASNYLACDGNDQTINLPDATSWWMVTVMGASAASTIDQAASLAGEGVPIFEGVPFGPVPIPSTEFHIKCTSSAGKIWMVKCQPLP